MLLNIFSLFLCMYAFLSAENLEEKVGQLLIVHFHGEEANEDAHYLINDLRVGGIIYFNWSNNLEKPEQVQRLSESLKQLSPRPLWICLDQEGDPVARLKHGPFRGQRQLAGMNSEAIYEQAVLGARYLRELGINLNLAPVVDISTDPKTAYIAKRCYGDDPSIVLQTARPVLSAYSDTCVLAVLKHFPGYGDVTLDPHCGLPILSKNFEQLMNWEWQPYKHLKADAIMSAHVMIPALDSNHCATFSTPILNILRNDLNFKGLLISDSLVMQGALEHTHSVEEAAIQALLAGCDLLILGGRQKMNDGSELDPPGVKRVRDAIVQAIQTGRLPESRIDDALSRSRHYLAKYR